MDILLYLGGILFMVLALTISIALHEIGHLVPAKLFGVRVSQYMVGFGKTLWSTRRGGTEYGVKALPLGGYISMAGMYPHSGATKPAGGMFRTLVQEARDANDETIVADAETGVFYRLPVWKRVIVMLGGPFMNLLLALLVFTIVFSGIGVQQGTTTIATVSECVLPAGSTQTECGPEDPAAPAAEAGLLPGDVLLSVDGQDVETFADAAAIVQASPGESLPVVVERDGAEVALTLTPVLAERAVFDERGQPVVDEDGAPVTTEVGYVGMGAQVSFVPQPIGAGAEFTWENTQAVAGIIVHLPARLWDVAVSTFTGGERDPNGPRSVVGVGRLAGEVAATDAPVLNRVWTLLSLTGSLNIALFVFNLIPLLPLDGGHVVVALWDGLRRAWAKLWRRPPPAPVDATRLVPVTIVVAALLIGMGALLLIADLINPVNLLG